MYLCVRACACVSNCFASWWTDRPPCAAAEWRAAHSGGKQTLYLPRVVMRDRHHGGPADTWVTLRESARQPASLFRSLTRVPKCTVCVSIPHMLHLFSLALVAFRVVSPQRLSASSFLRIYGGCSTGKLLRSGLGCKLTHF